MKNKRYKIMLTARQLRLITEAVFEYGGIVSNGAIEGTKHNRSNLALERALERVNGSIYNQAMKQGLVV